MTRIGQNPAKLGIQAYKPQKLGIATITYIPSLEGYFKDSFSILKLTIKSLEINTPERYDLLVFDNGSCYKVQKELVKLQNQGKIRWLILSEQNLGKIGAQNWVFAAMPNEWICYTDSDVLFRKGWLEASRAIISHFPEAGMVGAQPCFFDVLKGKGQAHLSLHANPKFQVNLYTPDKNVVDEYCRGINASVELSAKYLATQLEMVQVVNDGFQAGLGASHMQFLISSELARSVVPLPYKSGLNQDEDRQLDQRIDELGRLHISTLQPYVVHMGNVLDEWVRELAVSAGIDRKQSARLIHRGREHLSQRTYGLSWLANHKWTRNWLVRFYNKLFHVLSTRQ
ncbi:MAG: glycosyltransferase family 2 protein [Anaerolineaceae bacterium]|nr:glycosyltransferase family 2 protein [Anaerolineaceae bacterium]